MLRLRRTVLGFFWALVLLAVVSTAVTGWLSYRQTLAAARAELATLTRAIEVHIGHSLRASTNRIITTARDRQFLEAFRSNNEFQQYNIMLESLMMEPQAYFFATIDRTGRAAAITMQYPIGRITLSDRDYFQLLRDHPRQLFAIGNPARNRIDQRPFIPLAVPINNAAGFDGVLVAGLDPNHFRQFHQSLNLDSQTRVELVRNDGVLLLNYPFDQERLGETIPDTEYRSVLSGQNQHGTLDITGDPPMLLAYSRLENLPLIITVAKPRDTILARWTQDMLAKSLVTILLLGGISAFMLLLLKHLKRLSRSEQDLYLTQFAVDHGADLVIWVDESGRISFANRTAQRRLGLDSAELSGRHIGKLDPSLTPAAWAKLWQSIHNFRSLGFETRLQNCNGDSFPTEVSASYVEMETRGAFVCLVGRDISERKHAEIALSDGERRLRMALEASDTGLYEIDLVSNELLQGADFLQRYGYGPEMTLADWFAAVHPDDADRVKNQFVNWRQESCERIETEYRLLDTDGGVHWLLVKGQFVDPGADGQPQRLVGTLNDITERKRTAERFEHFARYDALTGLANRYYLNEKLAAAIETARDTETEVGVLFIDLDHFKNINDSLGHSVGDELLKEVANSLADFLSPKDTLARLGGDEFLIVLPDTNQREAGEIAACIVTAMSMPLRVGQRELSTTPTIGISLFPQDGDEAEALIRNADAAMYKAKSRGRNTYEFYTRDMNAQAAERLEMESQLRTAHLRGELQLHYQPQINSHTGAVIGCEALMRWRHPELGLVSPGRFIPIAEESGLIVPMGNWAIYEACRQNVAWRRAGLPPVTVAVNLSSLQFQQPNFVDVVADALEETGLDAGSLELELTESIVMNDVEQVIAIMEQLKELGVQMSIDDFGTGYSSLSYLKRFPVDKLKIDQSFVRDLEKDESDAAIVRAVIAVGQNLDLKLIAEGVETAGQFEFLRAAGVEEIQGYYFSKPLMATDFADRLACQPVYSLPTAATA